MKDQSTKNIKADVVATVTHNKDTWDFEDASSGYEETNNSISALGLSSGEWKGTFNFNINLRDVANSGDDKKDDANYGEDVTLTKDNLATYGIANTGDVVIPSEVIDSDGVKHKITSIGDSAFMGCSGLTSINIPDGVTSIGYSAFNGCTSLTSTNIPDGVTSIKNGTFLGCSSLTSINIPNSVTHIGDNAFYRCKGLTSITIPDSVTIIRNGAFTDCSNLTSITIPNSVTIIGGDAFLRCSSLTSVTIPNSVTTIGYSVFDGCTSLASITYKGTTYTNKTQLTSALTSNGVIVGKRPFDNTKLQ